MASPGSWSHCCNPALLVTTNLTQIVSNSLDKLCDLAKRKLSKLLESEASRFHCFGRRARLEIATVVNCLAILIDKRVVSGAV
jgi:hypothetical protein